MVQDLFIKSEAETLAEANAEAPVTVESATETASAPAGGKGWWGSRSAGRRRCGRTTWSSGCRASGLRRRRDAAATGGGLYVAARSAHSTYIKAITDGRGPGEIDGIASAGQAREMLAYTSMVLSAGVFVASYMLEQKEVRQ